MKYSFKIINFSKKGFLKILKRPLIYIVGYCLKILEAIWAVFSSESFRISTFNTAPPMIKSFSFLRSFLKKKWKTFFDSESKREFLFYLLCIRTNDFFFDPVKSSLEF